MRRYVHFVIGQQLRELETSSHMSSVYHQCKPGKPDSETEANFPLCYSFC